MKKISNNIKSIYLLAVIALISFCMFFFPAMPTSVKADAAADAEAAKSIIIKSAYVQVQKDAAADGEWAIMFRAEMDKTSYNIITNNGQEAVKFGMLIGPKSKIGDVIDYDTAIGQGFEEFKHVGTPSSGAYQYVDFGEGNSYSYSAGIRYNATRLSNLGIGHKDAAALELSAIPMYVKGGTSYAVVDNAKSCLPSAILVESYVREQAQDVEDSIPKAAIETYSGTVNEHTGDSYVCQSTNRLFASQEVNGDLEATRISFASSDRLFLAGVEMSKKNTLALNADIVKDLQFGDVVSLTVLKANGSMTVYPVTVATKVITRFYKSATSTLQEYYAEEATRKTIFYDCNPNSPSSYVSKQYNTFDGLYVLAKNISAGDSTKSLISLQSYSATGEPGKGFIGTFDGRGKTMDFGKTSQAGGGIFGTMSAATVKNVAFVNIGAVGAYYSAVSPYTDQTTFENVYIHTKSVKSFDGMNQGVIIGKTKNCTFKNVVIDCNGLNLGDYEDPEKIAINDRWAHKDWTIMGVINFDIANNTPVNPNAIVGGNVASNFYAVGTTPIMTTYGNTKSGATNYFATYFTDKMIKVDEGGTLVDIKLNQYYTQDAFAGADNAEKANYAFTLSRYAHEIITNPDKVTEIEETTKLKVKFVYAEGYHDMANAAEMNAHILANQADREAFDTNYWNVNASTGAIAWKTYTPA